MAGFGSGSSTYNRRAGAFGAGVQLSRTPKTGSLGAPQSAPAPSPVQQTGPPSAGGGPSRPPIQQAGPPRTSLGAPQGGLRLPPPTPVNISPPKPGGSSSISVSATRNQDLDNLRDEQKENIQNLKQGTGLASDATAIRTADAFEGAKNAAKYAGGEGKSGVRDTRQQQLTDAGLRENARRQTDLTLGREGMITSAIQGQLGGIMGQQQGMLGQQGIGLQAEGLRQQSERDRFGQGLAGQQFAADVGFRNQDNAFRAADQQLRGLQGAQDLYNGGFGGGGGWGGGGGGWGAPATAGNGIGVQPYEPRKGGGGFGSSRMING